MTTFLIPILVGVFFTTLATQLGFWRTLFFQITLILIIGGGAALVFLVSKLAH